MDKDLDFLITALSRSTSPFCAIYSQEQLMDMRDSFIKLQDLLRRSPIDRDDISCSPVRVKAGGNTNWSVPSAPELSTKVPLVKFQLRTNQVPNSVSSVIISDIRLNRNHKCVETSFPSSQSDESPETMTEVDERAASCSENFQALVPYQEEKTSQELVRYTPSPDLDDDEFESETLCANPSCGNTSILSFRIPMKMEMEYVWCNGDFNAQSTDSDMTIIADGCNFILNN